MIYLKIVNVNMYAFACEVTLAAKYMAKRKSVNGIQAVRYQSRSTIFENMGEKYIAMAFVIHTLHHIKHMC